MDRKEIESSVSRVVGDLDQKISSLEKAASEASSEKAVEVKDKAVEILKRVSRTFAQTANDVRNSDEFREGVAFVMSKSKELYENTMKKIDELAEKPEVINVYNKMNETADKVYEAVENSPKFKNAVDDIGSLFDGIKRSAEDFAEKEKVKETINYVKKETTELADKGLALLKEWLSPKGDD